jgi:colicin import membrane protein
MTDNFNRILGISALGHAAVFLFVFFQAVLIPRQPIDLRQAIRVDVVGLPEKMTELPPPVKEKAPEAPAQKETVKELPKKAEPEPEKPAAPKVDLNKSKKADLKSAQKNALAKLKALRALDKIKAEVGAKSAKARPQVVKGNAVSEGNSLTGLAQIEYDRYFDDIKVKIRDQFNLPQWLAEAKLRAQVLVLIDARGFIIKKTIRTSSGNEVFDAKALEAVENSSPLPEPPARLRGVLSTSGITFNFPQ